MTREELMNLKIDQYKIYNLRNREKKIMTFEQSFRDLWHNTKWYNIYVAESPRMKAVTVDIQNVFEGTMRENFPKFSKRHIFIDLRSSSDPKKENSDSNMPRHNIIKLLKTKDKDKFSKVAREK